MEWSSGIELWGTETKAVESIDGTDLGRDEYYCSYVDLCRPVLIRGATKDWSASRRWLNCDYLATALKQTAFNVYKRPVLELKWRKDLWPDRFKDVFADETPSPMDFPELAGLAAGNEFVFAYANPIRSSTALEPLSGDTAEFGFVGDFPRPRYYGHKRAFLHGRSYTDWHYHPNDETLMCQFGPSKVVDLLPPGQVEFDILLEIARHEPWIGGKTSADFPRLQELKPLRVHVRSGDALYIPPHWWHAVACPDTGGRLGITVAYCWGSPDHVRLDPRFPYRRFLLRHGTLRKRIRLGIDAARWLGLGMRERSVYRFDSSSPEGADASAAIGRARIPSSQDLRPGRHRPPIAGEEVE